MQNRTTHEDLKESGYRIMPFDQLSIFKNIFAALFFKRGPSRVEFGKPYIIPDIVYPERKSRSQNLSCVHRSVSAFPFTLL